MTIRKAVDSALHSSLISEHQEVLAVRAPLQEFMIQAPFIEFVSNASANHSFASDVAHVLTKVEGREMHRIRQIQKSGGRIAVNLPRLRLQESSDWQFSDPLMKEPYALDHLLGKIPKDLGEKYANSIYRNALFALLSVAETHGKVITCSPVDLKQVVQGELAKINIPCSVLTNIKYHRQVANDPFSGVVGDKSVTRRACLDENLILIVPNDPSRVGVISIESEPDLYTSIPEPGILRIAAVGYFRLCMWSNPQITLIEVSK